MGLTHYLLLAALLFAIGLFGLLTRRGIIPALMCVELMLNAVNINLVAFNHYLPMPDHSGQLMAIFSIAVAAAEIAIGVALAFRVYRDRNTVNLDDLDHLKG
ncbi:MAG: NADH-quinone oxidoreductase subunit NuoK [Schwartzia sp.]|nr:NADH-quinone oxidoreductase subunit NuoK [Schwartzia sp. (in: firmicutes)]